MREFELIAGLAARARRLEGVALGIGDDAAALEPEPGISRLLALDTMVEGVHWRPEWSSPFDVGWKLLARNLSDIAAMGGTPGPWLLGMSLGPSSDPGFVEGLLSGLEAVAEALAPGDPVGAIGGDTTRSPGPTILSLTLLGAAPSNGPVLRSGARPGDRVVVVGALGAAMAGLTALERGVDVPEGLLAAHRRPMAQVRAGAALGRAGLVRAMIDVSDGFAQDLGHMLPEGLGAELDASALPIPPEVGAAARELGGDPLRWALTGGDDYALVAAVAPGDIAALQALAAAEGFAVAEVGRFVERLEQGSARVRVLGHDGQRLDGSLEGHEHLLGAGEGR